MASLGTKFKASEHDTEQRGDYENLPDGIYKLEVSSSEVKQDKDAGKAGLKLTYDVVEPEDLKGRKIFSYINIESPNVQAQEIGQKELASLCRACGLDDIDDSEELHFIAFTAKVGMGKPSKDKDANGVPNYPAKNEIKRFFFPDQEVPEVSVAPVAANDNRRAANDNKPAAASAKAEPAKKRPWGK